MRVDLIVEGVIPDTLAWAHRQADVEGVTVGDVVARALERERCRVEGRKFDPRTRIVGKRGSEARMPPGTHSGPDVCELARIEPRRLAEYRSAGVLSEGCGGGARGKPYTLSDADRFVVVTLAFLEESAGPLVDTWRRDVAHVARRALDADRVKGVWIVVGPGADTIAVVDAHIGEVCRRFGSVLAVSLDRVQRRTDGRAGA